MIISDPKLSEGVPMNLLPVFLSLLLVIGIWRMYPLSQGLPISLKKYIWIESMTTEGAFEEKISLVSPVKWTAISTFRRSYIKVTPRTITHIMWELVRCSFSEAGWMAIIHSFTKCHVFLFWWFDLIEGMDSIFAQQTAIVLANVCISSCSIWAIVNSLPFRRNCPANLHNKIK